MKSVQEAWFVYKFTNNKKTRLLEYRIDIFSSS